MFRLNPAIDCGALKAEFARRGRVQIPNFLDEADAVRMVAELQAREDWCQIVNHGDQVWDLDSATLAAMPSEKAKALDEAVYRGARTAFQHRYSGIRVPDDDAERSSRGDCLSMFASWLSQGGARDLLRDVTGRPAIGFADAQATAYAPGDFLTAHHDLAEGKQRLAAYVFSLTAAWRIDYGGLLLFHRDDGNVDEGFVPRFNTLSLFTVPQLHSVSLVSPAAPGPRYSITGWLRSNDPDLQRAVA